MGVANKYGMTPDGKVARYFGGLTYMEEGQNASAESTLKQVAGGWNGDLAALAKLSLAQLYRQTGRDPQAIDLYNELTAKPTSTVPGGLAQLQLAELYETQGKPELAKKIYAQLKDKDPKGPAGMIAAQKLNPGAHRPCRTVAPPCRNTFRDARLSTWASRIFCLSFFLAFSAQKSLVKPRNDLTGPNSTISTWHFSFTQPAILDIDRKEASLGFPSELTLLFVIFWT